MLYISDYKVILLKNSNSTITNFYLA